MCSAGYDELPANDSQPLTVRVHHSISDLQELENHWNPVVDSSSYPNVFMRWEWISNWWKWFGKGKQLHILTVADRSRIVGIVPWYLFKTSILSPPMLHFIGSNGPTCPEYLGPILDADNVQPAIRAIVKHVAKSSLANYPIAFADVAPDDSSTKSLVDTFAESYAVVSRPAETCFYLSLPEKTDDFYGGLRKHTRDNKKRQLRRAREDYGAELEIIDDPLEIDTAFTTMLSLSASSRGRHGETSPFSRSDYAGFHRDVIRSFSCSHIVRIYILKFRDKPVAFMYGFIYKKKFYAFQTGFDANLSRYSPGDIIYQLIFQHLIGEQAREFDCLRGAERYKAWFATGTRSTEIFWLFPSRNSHYHARRCLESYVKPLRSKLRECLRTKRVSK